MKISASIQAANQLNLLNHIDSNKAKFDQYILILQMAILLRI